MDVFYDIRLCRELTAIAHPIPVHCTPGLSKYVIVIVVEDPLVVVIAHGPAQTKHSNDTPPSQCAILLDTERLVKAVRPHALPLGRGRGHAVRRGAQGEARVRGPVRLNTGSTRKYIKHDYNLGHCCGNTKAEKKESRHVQMDLY